MAEQLPDFVLAQLYPTSLVIVETEVAKSESALNISSTLTDELPEPKQQFSLKDRPENWYLGKNAKKITILVNESDAAFLNDANLDFLTKILGACKLNMGDVAVVNIARYLSLYPEIKKELAPSICIFFGVKTNEIQLPFIIPDYQIQQHDQCKFLAAPVFAKFTTDNPEAKLEKSKLWASLKTLFNI